jgi:hypothetical protein
VERIEAQGAGSHLSGKTLLLRLIIFMVIFSPNFSLTLVAQTSRPPLQGRVTYSSGPSCSQQDADAQHREVRKALDRSLKTAQDELARVQAQGMNMSPIWQAQVDTAKLRIKAEDGYYACKTRRIAQACPPSVEQMERDCSLCEAAIVTEGNRSLGRPSLAPPGFNADLTMCDSATTLPVGNGTGSTQPLPSGIKIWINSFIPASIKSWNPYGNTHPINGLTYIMGPEPWVSIGYLTDQRAFSFNPAASSRLHAEVAIQFTRERSPRLVSQQIRAGQTTAINTIDGRILCQKTANSSGTRFNSQISGAHLLELGLSTLVPNPCVSVLGLVDPAPPIREDLQIHVDASMRVVMVGGRVTSFPAFEAYMSIEGGYPKVLFQKLPDANSSPANIYFGPIKDVLGKQQF